MSNDIEVKGSAFAPIKNDASLPESVEIPGKEQTPPRKVSLGRTPMESEDAVKNRRHSIKERTVSSRRATKHTRVDSFTGEKHADRQEAQDKARGVSGEENEVQKEETKAGAGEEARPISRKPSTAPKPTVASLSRLLAISETHLDNALKRESELKSEVFGLKAELVAARKKAEKYYESVDARNGSLIEGVTHHMARSHHTAMQTIQSAQEMNNLVVSSAVGRSLHRLKHSGARIAALLPPEVVIPGDKDSGQAIKPSASTGASEAKTTNDSDRRFHAQVAAFLTEKVRDVSKGQELLNELDSTILEGQKAIDQEKANLKLSSNDPKSKDAKEPLYMEIKALSDSLERQERAIAALRYERAMLSGGLERVRGSVPPASPSPTPAPPSLPITSSKITLSPVVQAK